MSVVKGFVNRLNCVQKYPNVLPDTASILAWLAEQEVRGSIATISEIGYLLLPSRDMAEIPLKRRKSSKQSTNQRVLLVGT